MYEAHYGLTHRPFGETLAQSAHVPLPSRESIVRRLRYGLEHGQGPALLFGQSGAGKTLLARTIALEIGAISAHLTFPAMPTEDLLAFLAEEIGAGVGPYSIATALRRIRSRLSETAKRGGRTLLIIDEAHLIDDPATFEVLRTLQNFATLGPPDLMLLLVGGPEVLLRIPFSLSDRLTARCLLPPLSESESASYILGRLSTSGANSPLFDPEALSALHRASGGIPRRLNRLADLSLLVAYAEGIPRPDLRAVAIATRELDPDSLAA